MSTILSTLASALSYFALRFVSLLPCFLKKPKNPFSSSSTSKLFSSPTRPPIRPPTSPRSFVRTRSRAFSEKSAIFCCVPAPYCRIPGELRRSIFLENSSTCCFSSSERMLSSTGSAGFTSSGFFSAGSSGSGCTPKLSVGVTVPVITSNSSCIIYLPIWLSSSYLFNIFTDTIRKLMVRLHR